MPAEVRALPPSLVPTCRVLLVARRLPFIANVAHILPSVVQVFPVLRLRNAHPPRRGSLAILPAAARLFFWLTSARVFCTCADFYCCMPFPASCILFPAFAHAPFCCFLLQHASPSCRRVSVGSLVTPACFCHVSTVVCPTPPHSLISSPSQIPIFFAALHSPPSFLTPTRRVSPSPLKPSRRSSTPPVSLMSRLSGPASSPRPPPVSTSRVSSPASALVLALPPPLLPPLLPPPLLARLPPPPRPRLPSLNPKRRRLAASACSIRAAGVIVMRRAAACRFNVEACGIKHTVRRPFGKNNH